MTSCNFLRLVHIYDRYYVFLPTILHFYGNICTRPTSDQFDLKSTTKRTSDDPNVRLGRRWQKELSAAWSRQKSKSQTGRMGARRFENLGPLMHAGFHRFLFSRAQNEIGENENVLSPVRPVLTTPGRFSIFPSFFTVCRTDTRKRFFGDNL